MNSNPIPMPAHLIIIFYKKGLKSVRVLLKNLLNNQIKSYES
jgi:hypothetical protein